MPDGSGSFWTEFVDWIVRHNLGDTASLAGVVIALVGFGFTLMNVYRSKAAAVRAEAAAKETRESIRLFDTVSDFAEAISTMDEIKQLHRESAWPILPDRYASLRKLLVTLRSANPGLSENQAATIQSAIQNLKDMETKIELALERKESPKNVSKLNELLSENIDRLHEILVELKSQRSG